jgi:hypothetical protein
VTSPEPSVEYVGLIDFMPAFDDMVREHMELQAGEPSELEIACQSCGSFHLGVKPCGLTWLQRMKSVTIHPAATPTKMAGSKTYYDPEPIREVFGDDAQERVLDDTDGFGTAVRGPDGGLYRKDRHSGEVVPVSSQEADDFLQGAPEVDE